MYVGGMNGEDHLGKLATPEQLGGYAIVSMLVILLIFAGTWHNNSDLWDKLGAEMSKLGAALRTAFWGIVLLAPQTFYRVQNKILGVQEYHGRHRVAVA